VDVQVGAHETRPRTSRPCRKGIGHVAHYCEGCLVELLSLPQGVRRSRSMSSTSLGAAAPGRDQARLPMDRRQPLLLNEGEQRADAAFSSRGVALNRKVRLASALNINRSGLSRDDFSDALRAEFDSLVTKEPMGSPEFAVEESSRPTPQSRCPPYAASRRPRPLYGYAPRRLGSTAW
jgi:hypothetical protein